MKVCQYCGWTAPIDADVITEQWLRKQPMAQGGFDK